MLSRKDGKISKSKNIHLPSRNNSENIFKSYFLEFRIDFDGCREVPLDGCVEGHAVPELLGKVLSVQVVHQQRTGVLVGDAHNRNARSEIR